MEYSRGQILDLLARASKELDNPNLQPKKRKEIMSALHLLAVAIGADAKLTDRVIALARQALS
jgi:hypothetical protein